jgi:hypothetical protein
MSEGVVMSEGAVATAASSFVSGARNAFDAATSSTSPSLTIPDPVLGEP